LTIGYVSKFKGDNVLTRSRVRTLTGKEIELDIEPDYKARPRRLPPLPFDEAQT
jgi:hypothetical protein